MNEPISSDETCPCIHPDKCPEYDECFAALAERNCGRPDRLCKMKNFYLTFGQGHRLKDNWILIRAESYMGARETAFTLFGRDWSNLYEEDSFEPEYFLDGQHGPAITTTKVTV